MIDNKNNIKESYKVSGMTCASCAISIETYLRPLDGMVNVSVNYPNQSVFFEYDSEKLSIDQIQEKAKEIGYTIVSNNSSTEQHETFEAMETDRYRKLRIKLIFSIVFAIPVFIMSMFFMGKVPYGNWVMLVLSTPALFWCGSDFFTIAIKRLRHFSTNMDTLVALSTGVAYLFSLFNTIYPAYFINRGMTPHVYYESAVVIISLILLGRFLEERAKGKTSSAIKKLMGLKPKEVNVMRNGEEVTIAIEEMLLGDLILLKPGDKIPVDGKVKKGDSFVDESMITGEPIPVHKIKNDQVFAGTINQKGAMQILATKIGDKTLLAQIIKLVEEAQASKPNIQKLVDKIAGVFTPVVILIALISFFAWLYLGPDPSSTYAFLSLITVLIIACPCALGLATPTALMVGIGKGAEQGILIKDAHTLETAYKINALILDKTGTITEGRPEVTDIDWSITADIELLNKIIYSIESQSEHPIANAVAFYFKQSNAETIEVLNFESISGMGVQATYNGKTYLIGNEKLMHERKVSIPRELNQKAEKLKDEAKTVNYFSQEDNVLCIVAVADKIKESSKAAIREIQKMGIEIYMLTGDNEQTAAFIASEVGIKNYKASVMPADKGSFIRELQAQGKIVAMSGDGINDSAALAQADVGLAMGSGTDIAMESAGITLMQSDLNHIAKAILLSKETMKTIRQNLFWAFIYNVVAIPIAAGALYPAFKFLLNPMIAGAAMSLSSISVLMNSLRLKNKKLN